MIDEANQCQAIKNFLEDYARNSFWTIGRTHKKEVLKFLECNKNVDKLFDLIINLRTSLSKTADKTKGELCKRLITIEKMCGEIDESLEKDDKEIKGPT